MGVCFVNSFSNPSGIGLEIHLEIQSLITLGIHPAISIVNPQENHFANSMRDPFENFTISKEITVRNHNVIARSHAQGIIEELFNEIAWEIYRRMVEKNP